jgi:hypothetical protein
MFGQGNDINDLARRRAARELKERRNANRNTVGK